MSSPDNSLSYRLRLLIAHRDLLRSKVPWITERYMHAFRQRQLLAARRLKGKSCIEVAFFLTTPGMWKADYLFRAMQQNPRYHPFVVIYPYSQYKGFSKAEIQETLQRTEDFVRARGFEYVVPYDDKSDRWLDVKKKYRPDIVFFSSPYKDHLPRYFIYHFKDCLTCYIPYSFTNFSYMYEANYNLLFHNLVGCYFLETPLHLRLYEEHSRTHGVNGIVTGYPGTEVLLRDDYRPSDAWKPQSTPKKRIIWAPHHSIEPDGFAISTFLTVCDPMLKLADRYSDRIQISFKPHQLLKFKLYQLWGRQRTDEYYAQWNQRENTQLEESSYIDLFLTSDAMIHDSGSFTTDYLFTRKPVLFTLRDNQVRDKFSPFGLHMFDAHYHASSHAEIEDFILNTVINGHDPMAQVRDDVFSTYLQPVGGLLPSERIIFELENLINSQS